MQPRDVSDQRARTSTRRARAGQHVYVAVLPCLRGSGWESRGGETVPTRNLETWCMVVLERPDRLLHVLLHQLDPSSPWNSVCQRIGGFSETSCYLLPPIAT